MSIPLELLKLTEVTAPKEWRWKTAIKQYLTLQQMETDHIFNSMKMLYNHLADELGEETVWFSQEYVGFSLMAVESPDWMAFHILLFIKEIESRGDLSLKYRGAYEEIVSRIMRRQLGDTTRLIEAN